MLFRYSLVSKIGIKRNRIAYGFSNGIFIYLKIMLPAFGFLYINDVQSVPLNDDLCLQSVPLFFPE